MQKLLAGEAVYFVHTSRYLCTRDFTLIDFWPERAHEVLQYLCVPEEVRVREGGGGVVWGFSEGPTSV